MEEKNDNSNTFLYTLTFLSFVILIGCFATHLITGNPALIQMDSLAGSILIGIVLFFYLCWFIYDSKVTHNLTTNESIHMNMKSNPTVISMYFFWFVFILVPIITSLFF
ncbi:MAG: hypothetical protein GY699_07545 [Desulfobacteraceae bacterium]|nr:hypothetical protein [Desulfobacteraceae bacterium]